MLYLWSGFCIFKANPKRFLQPRKTMNINTNQQLGGTRARFSSRKNQLDALSLRILLWKLPLHVSNRQAVHPQEALVTVYADIGTYHAYTVERASYGWTVCLFETCRGHFQSKIHKHSASCWSCYVINREAWSIQYQIYKSNISDCWRKMASRPNLSIYKLWTYFMTPFSSSWIKWLTIFSLWSQWMKWIQLKSLSYWKRLEICLRQPAVDVDHNVTKNKWR